MAYQFLGAPEGVCHEGVKRARRAIRSSRRFCNSEDYRRAFRREGRARETGRLFEQRVG
jgi:hypothetical protein